MNDATVPSTSKSFSNVADAIVRLFLILHGLSLTLVIPFITLMTDILTVLRESL